MQSQAKVDGTIVATSLSKFDSDDNKKRSDSIGHIKIKNIYAKENKIPLL